jgi:hypothetical protein
MAGLFFSESLLEKFILHAQFGEHLFQSSVVVFNGFHLGDHRGVHAPALRAPFVERGRAHAVFTPQLCHRNTPLSLAEDRKDLRVAVSDGFLAKSPRAVSRENSTCDAPEWRGGGGITGRRTWNHSRLVGFNMFLHGHGDQQRPQAGTVMPSGAVHTNTGQQAGTPERAPSGNLLNGERHGQRGTDPRKDEVAHVVTTDAGPIEKYLRANPAGHKTSGRTYEPRTL